MGRSSRGVAVGTIRREGGNVRSMTATSGSSSRRRKGKPAGPAALRAEAEVRLIQDPAAAPSPPAESLLHELQVHQIELEMQNEELRRIQVELEETRDRYRDLYEFAPVAYLTLSRDGVITEINLTGAALLGKDRARLISRRFAAFVAAENLEFWHGHLLHALRHSGRHECDLKLRRADGTVFFGHLDLQGTDVGGAPGVRLAITDISRLKQAEDRLLKSQAQLKTLVRHAPVSIAMFDRHMNYLAASDRWLAEYGRGEANLTGLNDYEVHPDIPAEWRKIHQQGLAGATVKKDEDLWIQADGTRLWLRWAVVPWTDDNGAVGGIIISTDNITDHKQAENDLRQLAVEATLAEERERQAIAIDLHDDLGQLLHVARIKLDTLARAMPDTAAAGGLVDELSDLVAEASGSVRSLTSQLSPPALRDLGLLPALSWLADEMERVYGLTVVVKDDGAAKPLTPAQSAILFRAVRELLINVSKHAGAEQAVVRLRADGTGLRIGVEDQGIGMADWRAAILARKGFGLASVRERITFLKGAMTIRANPGAGTIVILEMPFESSLGEDAP